MSVKPKEADDLERDVDSVIAACGGNAREAIKSLIVTNDLLWRQIHEYTTAISTGFARGKVRRPSGPLAKSR